MQEFYFVLSIEIKPNISHIEKQYLGCENP